MFGNSVLLSNAAVGSVHPELDLQLEILDRGARSELRSLTTFSGVVSPTISPLSTRQNAVPVPAVQCLPSKIGETGAVVRLGLRVNTSTAPGRMEVSAAARQRSRAQEHQRAGANEQYLDGMPSDNFIDPSLSLREQTPMRLPD